MATSMSASQKRATLSCKRSEVSSTLPRIFFLWSCSLNRWGKVLETSLTRLKQTIKQMWASVSCWNMEREKKNDMEKYKQVVLEILSDMYFQ